MVNVSENRAQNEVTDCPETRNEDKIEKWTKMAWGGTCFSVIINNINYLMTIKAMSLTLDVQKDSIRYHFEVIKQGKEEELAKCALLNSGEFL
ncbi:hypothetical protein E3N88_37369 [Mikania micrantha]|uniref:Uncharacterized protein n=1 Tax=Mikania micrantha TaxID=192012 RepID=A0A5N6LT74_9ASTR|nr:hypothetical protein E3N88_37369 [Mikania micrantha]